MTVAGILHRQRVKVELLRRELELFALRIGDVEPAGELAAQLGKLIGRMIVDDVVLLHEKTRGHSARICLGGELPDHAKEIV